jgi:hypothetical protein
LPGAIHSALNQSSLQVRFWPRVSIGVGMSQQISMKRPRGLAKLLAGERLSGC